MTRTHKPAGAAAGLAVLAVLALLPAALPAIAGATEHTLPPAPATPDRENAMDTQLPTVATDPALAAWRGEILPGIRAFLAGEREALARLAAAKVEGPDAQRAFNRLCEERKLLGEREIALRQLAWAEAFGRGPLAERLRARVAALEAAWPDLPAAAARVYGSGGARTDAGDASQRSDGGAR